MDQIKILPPIDCIYGEKDKEQEYEIGFLLSIILSSLPPPLASFAPPPSLYIEHQNDA